jgi:hypothetical protein
MLERNWPSSEKYWTDKEARQRGKTPTFIVGLAEK